MHRLQGTVRANTAREYRGLTIGITDEYYSHQSTVYTLNATVCVVHCKYALCAWKMVREVLNVFVTCIGISFLMRANGKSTACAFSVRVVLCTPRDVVLTSDDFDRTAHGL